MKSRLALPDAASLTPEQSAIHASILKSRGSIDGPFLAWLHSPELATHAEKLGAVCRYQTSLALKESELLILCVSAQMECIGERQIHEPIALKAGVTPAEAEALHACRVPDGLPERERLLCELAFSLLGRHRIDDALYAQAMETFGTRTLVEIVGVIGYYGMVAHTLNAFEMSK